MIIFFVIIGIYWDPYFAYGVIKTGELKTINCPSCKELFLNIVLHEIIKQLLFCNEMKKIIYNSLSDTS